MRFWYVALVGALVLWSGVAFGQADELGPAADHASGAPAAEAKAVTPTGAALIHQLDTQQDKLTRLLAAFPAEKLSWRPAEGVVSVQEAYFHLCQPHFFLPKIAGVPIPEGVDVRGLRSLEGREAIERTMKRSFAHLREALRTVTQAQLGEEVELFGKKATKRDAYFKAVTHTAEHLGQLIAYARSNGIAPPWSGH